jgi:hypothetical protein
MEAPRGQDSVSWNEIPTNRSNLPGFEGAFLSDQHLTELSFRLGTDQVTSSLIGAGDTAMLRLVDGKELLRGSQQPVEPIGRTADPDRPRVIPGPAGCAVYSWMAVTRAVVTPVDPARRRFRSARKIRRLQAGLVLDTGSYVFVGNPGGGGHRLGCPDSPEDVVRTIHRPEAPPTKTARAVSRRGKPR